MLWVEFQWASGPQRRLVLLPDVMGVLDQEMLAWYDSELLYFCFVVAMVDSRGKDL